MEIDDETIKLVLSIWGAVLSTLLAILTLVKFSRDSQVKLLLIATIEKPFNEVQISICNKNNKPATLVSLHIGIGTSANYNTIIFSRTFDKPIKLDESEIQVEKVGRDKIILATKQNSFRQKEFQRLWVTTKISTGNSLLNLYI